MKRPLESIRIDPIFANFSTAAATSDGKVLLNSGQDFSVMVYSRFAATLSSGVTASAANYVQYTVTEGTAATANASAISGATLTLGAATAGEARGIHTAMLLVSSNLTTATKITINGIDYQTTQTGVGTSGEGVAEKLASAINGNATSDKLPHYRAVANYNASGQILIEPDDDMGTGLTLITTAAASTIVPYMIKAFGCIDVAAHKLSTASPKYIGIQVSTYNGVTAVNSAFLVRRPSASPCFPGRVVSVTS